MKTLYILDGYSSMYTSYFAGFSSGMRAPSGEPTFGTFIFVKSILRVLNEHEPDLFCIAVDGPAEVFRKKIYPEYKANRKKEPPEDLFPQVNRMKEILNLMGFPIYYAPGFEADDVIATIVKKADEWDKSSEEEIFPIICTKDKDLIQLLKYPGVGIFDMYKNQLTVEEDVEDKYGIRPSQFTDYLGLVGDASDNIPGVKGIGPKGASKLLNEYGSLEGIYSNIDDIKGATRHKLLASRADFNLSRSLATLREDINMEINFKDMVRKEPNWDKLIPIFEELGFNSLINIDDQEIR